MRQDALASCQALVFFHQLVLRLHVVRIVWNTVNRANLNTLRGFVVADAFRTKIRVDHVNVITRTYRFVWTLGFTYVAVDAFIGNI